MEGRGEAFGGGDGEGLGGSDEKEGDAGECEWEEPGHGRLPCPSRIGDGGAPALGRRCQVKKGIACKMTVGCYDR